MTHQELMNMLTGYTTKELEWREKYYYSNSEII